MGMQSFEQKLGRGGARGIARGRNHSERPRFLHQSLNWSQVAQHGSRIDRFIELQGSAEVEPLHDSANVDAFNNLTATANGAITATGPLIAGGNLLVDAGGAANLADATAGGYIDVTGQSIAFGNADAGGFVSLQALGPGATDGIFLEAIGIPTYGAPGVFIDADFGGIHGLNERIRTESLYAGRDYLYDLVKAYAG